MNIEHKNNDNTDDVAGNNEPTNDKQGKEYQVIIDSAINEIRANLAENTKYHEIISCSTKELSILVQEFDALAKDTDKTLKEAVQGLKTQIQDLHTEVFVLRKLPEKIQESLKNIVPAIAKEIDNIHKDILNNFNENIRTCNDNLYKLSDNSIKQIEKTAVTAESTMDRLILKSKELSGNHLKKTFINIMIIVIISTLISLASSYFMIQKVPTKVIINEASGDVHIEKSDVGIWSRDYKLKEQYNHKPK